MPTLIYIIPSQYPQEAAWHSSNHARHHATRSLACCRGDESEKLLRACGMEVMAIGAGGTFDFATPLRLRKYIDRKELRDDTLTIVTYTLHDAKLAAKVLSLSGHKNSSVSMMYFTAEPPTLPSDSSAKILRDVAFIPAEYIGAQSLETAGDKDLWIGDITEGSGLRELMSSLNEQHRSLTVIGTGEGRHAMPLVRYARESGMNVDWKGLVPDPTPFIANAANVYYPAKTPTRSLLRTLAPNAQTT